MSLTDLFDRLTRSDTAPDVILLHHSGFPYEPIQRVGVHAPMYRDEEIPGLIPGHNVTVKTTVTGPQDVLIYRSVSTGMYYLRPVTDFEDRSRWIILSRTGTESVPTLKPEPARPPITPSQAFTQLTVLMTGVDPLGRRCTACGATGVGDGPIRHRGDCLMVALEEAVKDQNGSSAPVPLTGVVVARAGTLRGLATRLRRAAEMMEQGQGEQTPDLRVLIQTQP